MPQTYVFAYSETALTFLEGKVQAKHRGQVKRKIDALATDPMPPGTKKVLEHANQSETVYRIRSGDYRVLYIVRKESNEIVILDIDHRKDFYR